MTTAPLSSVSWSPIDALKHDMQFAEKWVEPESIKVCLRNSSWIVSGDKGSGKSAIRVALRDIYRSRYDVIREIDFKDISFSSTYENIAQITNTTSIEALSIISSAWQHVIISQVVEGLCQISPSYNELAVKLKTSIGGGEKEANLGILSVVEDVWNLIDKFTKSGKSADLVASGGLTAKFLSEMRTYPIDHEYRAARTALFKRMSERHHRTIIILDGLDQLYTDVPNRNSLNLVFAGLADAVLRIGNYDFLPTGFSIKAIVPHERYTALRLRDYDKLSDLHSHIKWDYNSLQEFVRRRIELSNKTSGASFSALWRTVMPDEVTNVMNDLPERSFDYIVRHTMYRPRHIQKHMGELVKANEGKHIDDVMVSRAVSMANLEISKGWLEEYGTDFPGLNSLVALFDHEENIMSAKKFREKIYQFLRRNGSEHDPKSISETLETLYQYGMFGIVTKVEPGMERTTVYYPPVRSGNKYHFDFYFKSSNQIVAENLKDDDEIALHPVFNEKWNLRTDKERIVG